MADKKISQLTAASTPLAGTEVLPIVQSSATVKVATNDLTVRNLRANATTGILQVTGPGAGATRVATVPDSNFTVARTDAANSFTGAQTLATDNLIVGTAGKGIDFSANTNAAGMTSELLTWYEEGAWTPTLRGSGTAGTYEVNAGASYSRYTRVGRIVNVNSQIVLAAAITGGGTGDANITGLPFAKAASQQSTGVPYLDTVDLNVNAKYVMVNFPTGNASSTLVFNQIVDNGNAIALPISAFVASSVILLQISYFA